MSAPTCGVCRFFLAANDAARIGSQALYAPTTGECRRYPPRMVAAAERTASQYLHLPAAEWPRLEAGGWCGEFERPHKVAR